MDIVTHAMSGLIIAAPLAPTAPLSASAFLLGSVVPDIDMLVRCFGKLRFLRSHQTYTHALPVIVLAAVLCWPVLGWLGADEPWAPLVLAAGLIVHSLMDMTNTYGVALFAPLGRRRFNLDWIFFIDAPLMAASVLALVPTVLSLWGAWPVRAWPAIAYGGFLAAYWPVRWAIRRRAWRLSPEGTRSLVPSSLTPWRFHGLAVAGQRARLFDLNAVTGAIANDSERPLFDRRYQPWLEKVAEYRLMRDLSVGYYASDACQQDGEMTILCADLRTRNFGGRYGMLEMTFDSQGNVRRKLLHV